MDSPSHPCARSDGVIEELSTVADALHLALRFLRLEGGEEALVTDSDVVTASHDKSIRVWEKLDEPVRALG